MINAYSQPSDFSGCVSTDVEKYLSHGYSTSKKTLFSGVGSEEQGCKELSKSNMTVVQGVFLLP